MTFEKVKPPIKKKIGKESTAVDKAKSKWWLEKDSDIYISIFGIVNKLNTTQSIRHLTNIKYARLYENLDVMSYALGFYDSRPSLNSGIAKIPTWNVVKSCIDTVANKISKSTPKIEFITEGGNFKLQTKAKNLTQYLEGLFNQTNTYETSQEIFKDAEKFGTGCGYVYANEENNIEFERVLPSEIIVDEGEGIYRKPRQIHRRKLVQRDVLKDMYPQYETDIESARTVNVNVSATNLLPPDMVLVAESWHLPSGPNAKDGKHAISIENCTLFAEPYTKNYFPFVFYRWELKTIGFWGSGLAEELAGSQLAINRLLRFIELAQERMAVPKVYLEEGSKISKDLLLNNGIGDIIFYNQTPPIFSPGGEIEPQIFQHLENIYQKCYEISGVSQLSAMSEKPAGLDSGIALSTYEDIQTERMSIASQRYEKLFIDIGKLMINISKDLYEEDTNITVKVVGNKFISKLSWKDVDMDEDQYSMRGFPVSLLPSTPAGKLSTIIQLMQAGFIPHEYALDLLNMPDLDKFISLQTAALNDINMLIGQMLDDGEYTPPEPFMNLDLALSQTHSAYLNAKTKTGIKPENLELLRVFMKDIQQLQTMAQPPAPAPQMPQLPAGPAPIAQGAPAPVSQLLPTQGIVQ